MKLLCVTFALGLLCAIKVKECRISAELLQLWLCLFDNNDLLLRKRLIFSFAFVFILTWVHISFRVQKERRSSSPKQKCHTVNEQNNADSR